MFVAAEKVTILFFSGCNCAKEVKKASVAGNINAQILFQKNISLFLQPKLRLKHRSLHVIRAKTTTEITTETFTATNTVNEAAAGADCAP